MRYDPDNPLPLDREALAEMRECLREFRQANRPRDEAIAELKVLAYGDTELLEVAAKALEIEWPGNGHDGPPLVKPRPKIRIRPVKAERDGKHDKPFLFRWREAFCAMPKALLNPLMRTVLAFLSFYMRMEGSGAFPSQRRLAADTGLSVPTIRKYIKAAIADGWLTHRRLWTRLARNGCSGA